ncbi:putative methyltransferase [Rubidibacter lacunae KORDI 51-2]|uniref:Putative methyltransferase n=1 Tax=Rubidibacter lacunae KORDI 51-2 TaxID=582515 RepID=U5D8A2_9CHRO|nr:L-histidine N(alpha)-methyltransferase [Rubidibacter lacunae]ERN40848.1 putative methyltransferase [Rubidibacter lacunae KORDI 51-2]
MTSFLQSQRPTVTVLAGDTALKDDGSDAIAGLTQAQKALPARFFYDDRGSQLFEQICDLPEYYLTRAETAIFRQYADDIAAATGACDLVELGSGSSTKTRLLLDAYARADLPLHYIPIDISAGILVESAEQLAKDYPGIEIHSLVGTYEQGLQQLPPASLPTRMVTFIGSSLGNFSEAESDTFFSLVAETLTTGEYFLVGIDLQKVVAVMEAAYNDSQGVTAEFNFNMLDHLNRRFDGDFQRDRFEHWTFYNADACQIETYLRAKVAHQVRLATLDLTVDFAVGETMLTEIARKFDLQQMQSCLDEHSLPVIRTFADSRGWFALLLCQKH